MGKAKRKLMKGQPRGSRSASGRKRDRTPAIVSACPGVARRQAFYGVAANDTNTCDALGRAYTAGLLGSGERARDLLIAGRRIAAQYWRVYGFTTPDSLARFQPQQGGGIPLDPIEEKRREEALTAALDKIGARGRECRRRFDELVIDINPDHGPLWLDTIVYAHRSHMVAGVRERDILAKALEGLEVIA